MNASKIICLKLTFTLTVGMHTKGRLKKYIIPSFPPIQPRFLPQSQCRMDGKHTKLLTAVDCVCVCIKDEYQLPACASDVTKEKEI